MEAMEAIYKDKTHPGIEALARILLTCALCLWIIPLWLKYLMPRRRSTTRIRPWRGQLDLFNNSQYRSDEALDCMSETSLYVRELFDANDGFVSRVSSLTSAKSERSGSGWFGGTRIPGMEIARRKLRRHMMEMKSCKLEDVGSPECAAAWAEYVKVSQRLQ